ncbi:MAG: hypothetical protein N3F67_00285 [Acidilobaceae archaeon]|nr:hypothetical protein [Acidilobaceae archaeon]
MLKLTLSPLTLEKDGAAARKALEALVEEAPLLRVYSYPSLDALIASGLLFLIASKLGARAALKVSPEPPKVIEADSVLVGYRELNYKAEEVKRKALALFSGELKAIPVHGTTYVDGEGSHAAMVALIAWEELDSELLLMALAGSYASRYVSEMGRFSGLDLLLLEKLKANPNLSLSMKTVLKTYKPHERDVCTAMTLTLDPYYPGITGRGDCSVLAAYGVGSMLKGEMRNVKREELEALAGAVLDYVKDSFKVELRPEAIVGGVVVSENKSLAISDPREASHALLYAAEALRDLSRVAAAMADVQGEYSLAEARLEAYGRRLAELVGAGVTRLRGNYKAKVYEVQISKGDSPTLLWRALRTMGLVEQDSVLAFKGEDGLYASPLQVEEALGYGGARRVGEWREGLVWLGRAA